MSEKADVIIIGAGLAGLVATFELLAAGKKVIVVDQEPANNIGGQGWWSLGGLLFVNSPEQRLMGIKDSPELCLQDWMGSARFDRPEDDWAKKWAEAYVNFASGEKRAWLHGLGMRWFKVVGWAERGGGLAHGHGNSVPRFHLTWGTGTGVVEPFVKRALEAAKSGKLTLHFRHRVTSLTTSAGVVTGVTGDILEPSTVNRSEPSSRTAVGQFEFNAQAVVIASGGIGGNLDLVRQNWPRRLGTPPRHMICGVPDYVDGSMLGAAERIGARITNSDRMWHYVEGIHNWAPVWSRHAIRILPGPSSIWFDGRGNRLPAPLFPGFDTLATLEHLMKTGFEHSWFILNAAIIKKEFALSGSEQNPDFTSKSMLGVVKRAIGGIPGPVKAFMDKGKDFIVERKLEDLVRRMNEMTPDTSVDFKHIALQIAARDREIDNEFSKDLQVTAIRGARMYRGDRLVRTVPPHKILDPKMGPLIAVKLNILTRKSLGGLQTDLDGRVLTETGAPLTGLYAAGEAAGFGGGGVHGYSALEGTFLGGCLFTGRTIGRHLAKAV